MYWMLVAFHVNGEAEAVNAFGFNEFCEQEAEQLATIRPPDIQYYQCIPVAGDYNAIKHSFQGPYVWKGGPAPHQPIHTEKPHRRQGR